MRKSFFLTILLATAVVVGGGVGEAASVFAAQTNMAARDYQNHVHKEDIEYAVKSQLMWLFPDGNFRPNQTITQADLVVGLVQVKGLKEGEAIKDFPVGHWAKSYYERAVKDGILKDVAVEPNKVLTREEAAYLLINAWESVRLTRTKKDSEDHKNRSQIVYAVATQMAVVKPGEFPNGEKTNLYDSKSLMTRGEAAYSFHQLHIDLTGINESEKLYSQFRSGLKLTNKTLSGDIPSSDKYFLEIKLFLKGSKVKDIKQIGMFTVDVTEAERMDVRVVYKGKGVCQEICVTL
ncbi:S-layer homology domain-containing protein [uncultured Brevibacillus sp.]|uniref:S-layer homology domain-containing protein n=1 Tax=uncultured Brevibacillus sp. TaxID=169970 RepID=UPI0025964EC5|nr:S-layer homology domain-containing protein [uncultured Brevibacillus sp.]